MNYIKFSELFSIEILILFTRSRQTHILYTKKLYNIGTINSLILSNYMGFFAVGADYLLFYCFWTFCINVIRDSMQSSQNN